jgi:hypothetical protein
MAYTTINDPSVYFQTTLYTGNGGTQSVTNGGNSNLQPDWLWIKDRDDTYKHILVDSVRGATKHISSNSNAVEVTNTANVTSFASNGFALSSDGNVNANNDKYAAWQWKANGQGSSNTNGSINTTYTSANTTAGFSIVAFTGTGSNATVGHGLGVIPSMIIVKNLSVTQEWAVYHASLGATKYLELNLTGASGTASNRWNNTSPTNSVFSVGSDASVNGSSNNIIAYCFAEKQGYSKFGSYTGNGNADGTFVYTGFRVGWLMIKNTSTGSTKWTICDSKRDGFNDNNHRLFASEAEAESTSNPWEMYSNGFKMTTTGSFVNASGSNYIYMAFAEHPFTSSTGTPVTAR